MARLWLYGAGATSCARPVATGARCESVWRKSRAVPGDGCVWLVHARLVGRVGEWEIVGFEPGEGADGVEIESALPTSERGRRDRPCLVRAERPRRRRACAPKLVRWRRWSMSWLVVCGFWVAVAVGGE